MCSPSPRTWKANCSSCSTSCGAAPTPLRLRLPTGNTRVPRTACGASFVGFHVIGGRIRLRNSSLLRIRRALRRRARALAQRRTSSQRSFASAQSRDAHLAHGNTGALRLKLFAPDGFDGGLPSFSPLQ